MITFIVEPGGYASWVARFSSGLALSLFKASNAFCAAVVLCETIWFGS